MFHRPLHDVLDPFPSFVTHHLRLSTPTALPTTGIRRSPCATPHEGLKFGHLVEPTLLTPNHQINLGCASHSMGLHSPLWPASEAGRASTHRDASNAIFRGTRCGVATRGGPNDPWAAQASHDVPLLTR